MSIEFLTFPQQAIASIGIIATNEADLRNCLSGLRASGFDEGRFRIMTIRNFGVNLEDGYSGISRFLDHATGRFLMVLHQDVTPIDSFAVLSRRLDELDGLEPGWALAGNSGHLGLGRLARRISDPYGQDQRIGSLPAKVWAVDENVLILNLQDAVRPSATLRGFHFYGTDLAFRARLKGRGTYVIDWHVRHASGGKMDKTWDAGLVRLEAEYDTAFGDAVIQVPTTILLFGRYRPLRRVRKTLWRAVRHGSTALKRLGLMR